MNEGTRANVGGCNGERISHLFDENEKHSNLKSEENANPVFKSRKGRRTTASQFDDIFHRAHKPFQHLPPLFRNRSNYRNEVTV